MIRGCQVNVSGARLWASEVGLRLKYAADLDRLQPLAAPFVRLDVDAGTASYLGRAEARRHGFFVTWLHRALRGLLSDFDINGLLGTYPMHVLSTEQWSELLEPALSERRPPGPTKLLDVGAGRGDVTATLAPLFDKVVVTETSRTMARRLKKAGYHCLDGDLAAMDLSERFSAVSLLNVLDRCDRPLSLLGAARSVLETDGLLIIALVLPYHPFVYDSGVPRSPMERLPIRSETFEEAAVEFVSLALLALGLELVCVSRAPYLSGGDAHRPLYELDDLIVVCRALGPPPPLISGAT